jgi:hypothetical protein
LRRLGLQVGTGGIRWQPILPELDAAALAHGWAGSTDLNVEVDAETLELVSRLPKTAEGLADLTPALSHVLGGEAEGLEQG